MQYTEEFSGRRITFDTETEEGCYALENVHHHEGEPNWYAMTTVDVKAGTYTAILAETNVPANTLPDRQLGEVHAIVMDGGVLQQSVDGADDGHWWLFVCTPRDADGVATALDNLHFTKRVAMVALTIEEDAQQAAA